MWGHWLFGKGNFARAATARYESSCDGDANTNTVNDVDTDNDTGTGTDTVTDTVTGTNTDTVIDADVVTSDTVTSTDTVTWPAWTLLPVLHLLNIACMPMLIALTCVCEASSYAFQHCHYLQLLGIYGTAANQLCPA